MCVSVYAHTHTQSLPSKPGNHGQPSSSEHTQHLDCSSQTLRLPPCLSIINIALQLVEPKSKNTANWREGWAKTWQNKGTQSVWMKHRGRARPEGVRWGHLRWGWLEGEERGLSDCQDQQLILKGKGTFSGFWGEGGRRQFRFNEYLPSRCTSSFDELQDWIYHTHLRQAGPLPFTGEDVKAYLWHRE